MSQVPSTPYQSVGVYDAPGMILSQLAGGVASFGSVGNTLLDPQRLTPEERKSVGDRVAPGSPSIVRRVIDTATNPLVLLMLMSYAPVGRALKAGIDPFVVAAKNNPLVSKSQSILGAMGLLTVSQATVGSHAMPVMQEFHDAVVRNVNPLKAGVAGAAAKFAEFFGVDTLDNKEIARRYGREKAQEVKGALGAVLTHANGLTERPYEPRPDREVVTYGVAVKNKEKGQWVVDKQGTDANSKFEYQKVLEEVKAWENKRNDLYDDARQAASQGRHSEAEKLMREAKAFHAEGPERRAAKKVEMVARTADDEPVMRIDLEGEEGRGQLKRAVDAYFEQVPVAREYAESLIAGREGAKGVMWRLGEDGQPTQDRIESLGMLAKEKLTQKEGIVRTLESGFGTAAEEGSGLSYFFDPEQEAGWQTHTDHASGEEYHVIHMGDGTPFQTKQDHAYHMGRAMKGGERIADHYIPINSYHEITPEGMGPNYTPMNRKVLESRQEGEMPSVTNSLLPKAGRRVLLTPDTLDMVKSIPGLEAEAVAHLEGLSREGIEYANKMARTKGEAVLGVSLHPAENIPRYIHEAGVTGVLADKPGAGSLAAQKMAKDQARGEVLRTTGKDWDRPGVDPMTVDLVTGKGIPMGESWSDMKQGRQTYLGMLRDIVLNTQDPNVQNQLKTAYMGIVGRKDPQGLATLAAHHQAKAGLRSFLGTKLGKFVSATVPKFGAALERLSDPEAKLEGGAGGFWGKVASYFYVSHLGVNLGSMTVNAMQPWTMVGPLLGVLPTGQGYVEAIKDLYTYGEARGKKFGLRMITQAERQGLMDEVVPHWKDLGIGASQMELLDSAVYGKRLVGGKPGVWDKVTEFALKGFEKSEIMNRLVAGHAYTFAAEGKVGHPTFGAERRRFVETTQFGGSAWNTPQVFTQGFWSNPVIKQFLTFPVRTFTGIFHTAPLLGGEENQWRGLGNMMVRGLGMSAIIYEAGKGLIGADLSRGLFASGATAGVGGDRYFQTGNDWIPVPPILAVPHDFISAVAQGDHAKLVDAVARTFPGGIAATRLMGVLPAIPVLGPELQKTTADWSNPLPDGRVAVWKDGRLVDYRAPSDLVMRGLGVDMGRFNEPGALDGYLVKQRQEILNARQMWLARWVSQDYRGAAAVKAEFEKRFKVPLTVTQQQLKQFIENRNVPRPERVLDKLPPEVRQQYAAMVASSSSGLNVDPRAVAAGGTSGSRGAGRQRTFGGGAQPLPEAQQEATQGTGLPFGGFGGF